MRRRESLSPGRSFRLLRPTCPALIVVASLAAYSQVADFRNLEVLGGVAPPQMAIIMQATSVSLGVDCDHCHVPGDFARDDIPAKATARNMMRMVERLSSTTFELLEAPSCWTCHRGSTLPEASLPPPAAPIDAPFEPFSDSTRPAGEIYENVQVYEALRANELGDVMAAFTRALGVGCDHCHVPGDWASEGNVLKQLTRIMVEVERSIAAEPGIGDGAVTCWTCHRGAVTPRSNIPPGLMPRPENP